MRDLSVLEMDVVVGGYTVLIDKDQSPLNPLQPTLNEMYRMSLDQLLKAVPTNVGYSQWALMGGSGPGAAASATCPAGHTCTAYTNNGINEGKYVVDQIDGKIYFSDAWAAKVANGTINWGGVLRDLGVITGGGLAGMGAAGYGIFGGLLGGYSVWGYDQFTGNHADPRR